jgi:pimeloyl-ACP methyl ester carboxylesterase
MTPDRSGRAVVIVSGGAAVSPFTTPDAACAQGLAAGNTDTFLREGLLEAGFEVYTSPAGVGVGQVSQDSGWGGFCDGPPALPAEMTVNAVGGIDEAGRSLARFMTYVSETYGIEAFDLVAHSMGGLFSRAAIRTLEDAASPLRIRTLTTIGTPWEGGFTADYAAGDLGLEACDGDPFCEKAMGQFDSLVGQASQGAGEQVTAGYLAGPDGWNERQGDALSGIPVLLIAGDHLKHEGGVPEVWPHDGLVALRSGTAERVSERVLPSRSVRVFPDVHSIYFADQLGLAWERALTWDPDVLAAVVNAIERPGPAPTAHGID